MSVVQSLQEVGPCRRQLEIEVPKAAADAETTRVVEYFRKSVNIAGFRKGKAPAALVRKQYASDIRQEVLDRLVPRYWKQAEAEKELEPLTAPQLESVEFEIGGELKFVAIVEVRPEITLGDIDQFDFPVVVTEPTDEEVEDEVTAMRRRFGDWKPVKRAAAQGDLVKIHVRKGDAEEEDPLSLEVGEERVWEEISLAVTGLKAGGKSTFERAEPPAEGQEGEPEKVQYSVRVETVEEKILPELTDAWVKEFTELEGVETLRDRIRDGMKARLAENANRGKRQVVMNQLRERHPIALPEGVVMDEIESMLRHYAENLARQGVDVEKAGLDFASLAERFRPQAEQTVHADLILDAIAAERSIEVPAERLEGALAQIAAVRKTSTLNVRRALASEGRLEKLQRQLKRDEVISNILGDSNVITEEASAKKAGKSAGKEASTKKTATKKKAATTKKAAAEKKSTGTKKAASSKKASTTDKPTTEKAAGKSVAVEKGAADEAVSRPSKASKKKAAKPTEDS